MANLKSDGKLFDANLIIQTGSTITAGSLVFSDISGTNVVRMVRGYSGTTPETNITLDDTSGTGRGIASLDAEGPITTVGVFLGVLANTQTGVPNLSGGHQTGVTWYTEGVFEFNAGVPTASCSMRVGQPVWATRHDTVACLLSGIGVITASALNTTGLSPIGIINFIPGAGLLNTNSAGRTVRVKLFPFRTIASPS